MIRSFLRILPLFLLLASGILLLKGSPLLTQPLSEGLAIPLGTLIAWLGMSMLPLSILLGIRYIRKPISLVYRKYNRLFRFLTVLGAAWGLVSFLLAGNWSLTFSSNEGFQGSDAAFDLFIGYTAFVSILSLLSFIIFLIHHLIITLKQKR
jgi:hypothetical protein